MRIEYELIERCGIALYGDAWKPPLARDLGIHKDNFHKWRAGLRSIPLFVGPALARAITERRGALDDLLAALASAGATPASAGPRWGAILNWWSGLPGRPADADRLRRYQDPAEAVHDLAVASLAVGIRADTDEWVAAAAMAAIWIREISAEHPALALKRVLGETRVADARFSALLHSTSPADVARRMSAIIRALGGLASPCHIVDLVVSWDTPRGEALRMEWARNFCTIDSAGDSA